MTQFSKKRCQLWICRTFSLSFTTRKKVRQFQSWQLFWLNWVFLVMSLLLPICPKPNMYWYQYLWCSTALCFTRNQNLKIIHKRYAQFSHSLSQLFLLTSFLKSSYLKVSRTNQSILFSGLKSQRKMMKGSKMAKLDFSSTDFNVILSLDTEHFYLTPISKKIRDAVNFSVPSVLFCLDCINFGLW